MHDMLRKIKADSFFGKKLDLPTLGVDIPSGDKVKEALSRGKKKVQHAKKKTRDLANKNRNGDAANGGSSNSDSTSDGSSSSGGELEEDRIQEAGVSSDLKTPYFETTYVDGDMRIGRTGQGDVFISARA